MDQNKKIKSICLKKNMVDYSIDISIVIPTYKRAKHLEEAINSAIGQKGASIRYEIIVVNNDPLDDMRDVIEKYKDIPFISFYKNEHNLGMGGNINRCAILAEGKYVAYLHDDDMLKDNYLSVIEKMLQQHMSDDIGSIIVNREYLFMNGQPKKVTIKKTLKSVFKFLFIYRYFYRKRIEELTPEKVLRGWSKNFYLAPTCGTLFDREKMIELGLYDESLFPAFDYMFFLRMNEKYRVLFLRDRIGIYRWDDNASGKSEVKIKTCLIRLGIINGDYINKKCDYFFRHNRDVLNYMEVNKYSVEERKEIIKRSGLHIKTPSRSKVMIYKLKNYCYRMIHNLDY